MNGFNFAQVPNIPNWWNTNTSRFDTPEAKVSSSFSSTRSIRENLAISRMVERYLSELDDMKQYITWLPAGPSR